MGNGRFASQIRGRGRTLCRLKHRELLDAARIIPDNMPEGKSTIDNGLSLCKLHHSAYDAFIIGVTFPPSPSLKGTGCLRAEMSPRGW